MDIHTTARHFELDPEDRLFAQERITKLGRFDYRVTGKATVALPSRDA